MDYFFGKGVDGIGKVVEVGENVDGLCWSICDE